MTYLFPTLLTLGLPLAFLPLLIHLINLRRRRRIEWAAMEFLLESQKRNKKWILLKQLLLLLLRTLAIACVAFMLAGPVVESTWASLFGGGVTHHLLLLDDSYSMADRGAGQTVQQEATRVVQQIVAAARGRAERQVVTLLPFSVARGLAAGAKPPIDRAPLDASLLAQLTPLLSGFRSSETSAGPADAWEAVQRLPERREDETRIVYTISDFRAPQWRETTRLSQLAADVRSRCSLMQLVHCAQKTHPNLAVVDLRPESGVRAAGIETWMNVVVANYGDEAVATTTLELRHNDARLPALQFGEVLPGEQATRRFRVALSAEGSQITAQLPDDALPVDNLRYFAVRPPVAYPILIVDESQRGDDGRYLSTALSPGGRNIAGWTPQIERRSFLRRGDELSRFALIVLLDVPRLDEAEVENLEQYASRGGGVAFFLGPQTLPAFYNQRLYRDGTGLLAAPLSHPVQLLRAAEGVEPDLQVGSDPLFRVFLQRRNSFLDLTKFDFFYSLDPQWDDDAAPTTLDGSASDAPTETRQIAKTSEPQVLARLRNRAPVVLAKTFGEGTVVLHLFKLSPLTTELGPWSNFAATPAFPVYVNELAGRLSAGSRRYEERSVDEDLRIAVPESDYLPNVSIRPPISSGQLDYRSEIQPTDGQIEVVVPAPLASGVWSLDWTQRKSAAAAPAAGANSPASGAASPAYQDERTWVTVNVAAGEGDLHLLGAEDLAQILDGVDYQFATSSQYSQSDQKFAGADLSLPLLGVLACLLVGEQLLAFSASYHAGGRRRTG